jgi:hypothetical protein
MGVMHEYRPYIIGARHFGVGTVSILPSAWMMVVVPLPFGTTIG